MDDVNEASVIVTHPKCWGGPQEPTTPWNTAKKYRLEKSLVDKRWSRNANSKTNIQGLQHQAWRLLT